MTITAPMFRALFWRAAVIEKMLALVVKVLKWREPGRAGGRGHPPSETLRMLATLWRFLRGHARHGFAVDAFGGSQRGGGACDRRARMRAAPRAYFQASAETALAISALKRLTRTTKPIPVRIARTLAGLG